jgi:hypothetical protein
MSSHIVNIADRPNVESEITRPGEGDAGGGSKTTKFLGLTGENFVDPKKPPYAYYIQRPKGDVTPDHCHTANRIEFVLEGKIEWRERKKEPAVYGKGTLTYVEAGTIYGYTVLEDATILIIFEEPPGMNYR